MTTLIFRNRSAGGYSIERIFDGLYAYLQQHGTAVTRVELPHISTGLLNVARNIWFVFRQRRTGILHVTGDVHYAALLCRSAKVVITVHDCVVLRRGTGIKRFVLWLLWFRLPLALADAVTVVSEKTRMEVLRTVSLPPDKITVIPNYVGTEFRFSEKPFNGVCPRILHVGATSNKNLARVVTALRGLRCTLVIVGALDASIHDLLHDNRIDYENPEAVGSAAMVELYEACDVVSFPSTYEGFGMPILEGQAVGRPVLTSDAEPMRSVAGPNGALFVDPQREDAIRSGFERLFDDASLRLALVRAGLANVERFSIDTVAARYQAVYRTLDES